MSSLNAISRGLKLLLIALVGIVTTSTCNCTKGDRSDSLTPEGRAASDGAGESALIGFEVGNRAPDFQARTITSDAFRLSETRGKFVLLDFWGTWCRPCIEEIPHLKQANKVYSADDLLIVSVALDPLEHLKNFVSENDMAWTHIQQDHNGSILALYNINAFPTTFLIDREGVIVAKGVDLRQHFLKKSLEKFIR